MAHHHGNKNIDLRKNTEYPVGERSIERATSEDFINNGTGGMVG